MHPVHLKAQLTNQQLLEWSAFFALGGDKEKTRHEQILIGTAAAAIINYLKVVNEKNPKFLNATHIFPSLTGAKAESATEEDRALQQKFAFGMLARTGYARKTTITDPAELEEIARWRRRLQTS